MRQRPEHRFARLLRIFEVDAGEAKGVALFFGYAFLLVVSYYLLKSLREPLLLATGSAEIKSYAYALTAGVLLLLLPLYGALYRRTSAAQLVRGITVFFLFILLIFLVLGHAGVDIGLAYYVWVGVAGVTLESGCENGDSDQRRCDAAFARHPVC